MVAEKHQTEFRLTRNRPQKERIMAIESNKIDLTLFVGEGYGRDGVILSEPFIFNGWEYATDGMVIVRIPSAAENTKGNFPITAADQFMAPPIGELRPWPSDIAWRYARFEVANDYDEDEVIEARGLGSRLIGVHRIDLFYECLIASLPNVRWYCDPNAVPWMPLRFVFDGGEGAVMGILEKKPKEREGE